MTRWVGRQLLVDLLDQVHRQNLAVGLARGGGRAVARADGDGERMNSRLLDELDRLVGVGQGEISPDPTPSSIPAERRPSSPSTVTPTACACSTTSRVTCTL